MNIAWSTFHSTYSETDVNKYVPTDAGIYLLWVKLTNGNWKAIYAGQAKNLKTRLLEQLSNNEKNKLLKEKINKKVIGFEYAKVSLQSSREGIEQFLYDHYKPECNEIDPGGTPITVNLP